MINKLELGNTLVELREYHGKTIVEVTTDDADVIVNDLLLYSKYDKEEYLLIPPYLRSYIVGKEDYIKDDGDKVVVDIYKNNNPCASFYIPKNSRLDIVVRTDYINSIEELKINLLDEGAEDNAKFNNYITLLKKHENKILEMCKEFGYNWRMSHSVNEWDYAWYDIIIPQNKWNEKSFELIWDEVGKFNDVLRDVENQYRWNI